MQSVLTAVSSESRSETACRNVPLRAILDGTAEPVSADIPSPRKITGARLLLRIHQSEGAPSPRPYRRPADARQAPATDPFTARPRPSQRAPPVAHALASAAPQQVLGHSLPGDGGCLHRSCEGVRSLRVVRERVTALFGPLCPPGLGVGLLAPPSNVCEDGRRAPPGRHPDRPGRWHGGSPRGRPAATQRPLPRWSPAPAAAPRGHRPARRAGPCGGPGDRAAPTSYRLHL
ncbi:hypothetical protein DWB77_07320 [Streptomyces hundungensis]|uniref:Uncharacterized protein n=1 Tax=Streptomyces hundungensis TaxID=1077946 RepID=A0A387HNH2_9ACTN|nr:hypothetical protein DWB77_07320 [Streptomyces hundungensis]